MIVEDEASISAGLTDVFVYHGYDVEVAADGESGLRLALTGKFDLVLLDVMLPRRNGFDVCDAIRASDPEQPIIMLTAKVSDEDIVRGLRLGADDYVAKPFSVQQLVLRVAAVLRRTNPPSASIANIALDGIDIDTANLEGRRGANTIPFTRREMDVLKYLAANANRPVPREELLAKVWGYARGIDIETRTVDIHIAKLRRKVEAEPKSPVNLTTVRGAGYRLNLPAGDGLVPSRQPTGHV